MKFTISVLFFLILLWSPPLRSATEQQYEYAGRVLEISQTRMLLDRGVIKTYLGLAGEESALASIEKIKVGDDILIVFAGPPDASGNMGHQFLSIRVCGSDDDECVAIRKKRDTEYAQRQEAWMAGPKKSALCKQAMDATLAQDRRYVPEHADGDSIHRQAPIHLSPKQNACIVKFVKQHYAAFLEACELHRCGDVVGGGCSHMSNRIGHDGIREKAVEKCTSAPH